MPVAAEQDGEPTVVVAEAGHERQRLAVDARARVLLLDQADHRRAGARDEEHEVDVLASDGRSDGGDVVVGVRVAPEHHRRAGADEPGDVAGDGLADVLLGVGAASGRQGRPVLRGVCRACGHDARGGGVGVADRGRRQQDGDKGDGRETRTEEATATGARRSGRDAARSAARAHSAAFRTVSSRDGADDGILSPLRRCRGRLADRWPPTDTRLPNLTPSNSKSSVKRILQICRKFGLPRPGRS